jgi:hypothetical protein
MCPPQKTPTTPINNNAHSLMTPTTHDDDLRFASAVNNIQFSQDAEFVL